MAQRPPTPPAADPGFLFYIAGDVFLMSMPALPAAGTVWSLRSYVGTIAGAPGAYTFTPAGGPAVHGRRRHGGAASSASPASWPRPQNSDLRNVHTVPDPYYVKSAYEASTDQKVIKFVGLPAGRDHPDLLGQRRAGPDARAPRRPVRSTSNSQGSEMNWDVRNRNNQVVASGVYFYHVEAGDARRVGRFTVVNFAQ